MSIEKAREYLKQWGKDKDILEFEVSSATVELAAKALSVEPSRIAKTLSFLIGEKAILIVAAGDVKVDNAKYKSFFGVKAKMLTPQQAQQLVGHAVGGVCPFGVNEGVQIYLDSSVNRFTTVFPACGSSNSCIEMTPQELLKYSNAVQTVDVCRGQE